MTDYCTERGNKVDPQRFVDFYEAKGWRVGNTPMKDWKAAVRTWEQRSNAQSSYDQRSRVSAFAELARKYEEEGV